MNVGCNLMLKIAWKGQIMENLEVSLKRAEIKVKVIDDAGKEHTYTLRELSGKQRDLFLNSMGKRVNFVNGKIQGLKTYDGVQADLLALCLYDENNEVVKEDVIQTYPASVLAKLFKAAQVLSGFDEVAVTEIKND